MNTGLRQILIITLVLAGGLCLPGAVGAECCTAPDNGSGTIDYPPVLCQFKSGSNRIIAEATDGSGRIEGDWSVDSFFDITYRIGGSLGGEIEQFSAVLTLHMQGAGSLAGFERNISIPVSAETHTGPRLPGEPIQSFDTEMFLLQGQLPPGDPDFDLLQISAGTGFGLPSPGHTTLTRLGPPASDFTVDSFFDITYRIDFQGAPGSVLGGMSGSTTATIRLGTCGPALPNEGQNCFEAPPASSVSFADNPIPADFFGPGSEPFFGEVCLQGANPTGPDAVLQRLEPIDFGTGDMVQIEVEIVELSLTSCEPITVTNAVGQQEQWQLGVSRTSGNCCRGHVIIMKREAAPGTTGGIFEADLTLQPVFTFTKVGQPSEIRILDTAGQPPLSLQIVEPYPWQDTSPKTNPPCDGNGFYPVGSEPMVMRSPSYGLVLALEPPMPTSPYFALDTAEQWEQAMSRGRVIPVHTAEWTDYMDQWRLHLQEGESYPENMFSEAELYVWPGNECFCPNSPWPNDAGLVMVWGDPAADQGSHSSAWRYRYPQDPDLSNATVSISVKPPCGMNAVSFGMQDINGNIRAWYWNVAAVAGPGTLQCGVPTPVSVNGALTGVGATTPTAASYMNNPGFDITQVQDFLVDENFSWVGGPTPVPPPGQPIPRMWNYWYNVVVTPNPVPKPSAPTKWSQPPVECGPRVFLGWDEPSVDQYPPLLADDWLCTDKRPVTDIHWWGSFLNWVKPDAPLQMPIAFHIGIWTDVPKDPRDYKSFSRPGTMVWEHICKDYKWNFAGFDRDPRQPVSTANPDGTLIMPAIHDSCFQFNCDLPQSEWFYQDPSPCGKNVYWLSIAAIYQPDGTVPLYPWGWKTRPHFFNDDAVRIASIQPDPTGLGWPPQIGAQWGDGEPIEFPKWISWDLAFELTTNRDCPPAPLEADFDLNGIVNFLDFAFFSGQWLATWP